MPQQILANNLTKYFEDFRAVSSVSFEVNEGEIYGLLGPNGAGKTTTLRMLSGILKPNQGFVKITNFDIQEQKINALKNLGFLTGDTGLYERLNAEEMIRYFGELSEVEPQVLENRINELISTFEISEFRKKLCGKLSTGQKQRVSLARTLIHNPQVIILDEPTTGLDIIASELILKFIQKVKSQGKAIIFSTHNLSEVERLCDRIGIIHKGEMKMQGTLPEILDKTGTESLSNAFLNLVGDETYEI
ncbi:MAG: ATP-binding cassette domain-containing protein [Calditrichaeota bacterium]|nr:MAG: ATP-binding cassette domain-containing protein [Calditrichota bacterium]